ncbi:hypothetical protein Tco_0365444 [Tanacetum coccineum]
MGCERSSHSGWGYNLYVTTGMLCGRIGRELQSYKSSGPGEEQRAMSEFVLGATETAMRRGKIRDEKDNDYHSIGLFTHPGKGAGTAEDATLVVPARTGAPEEC